MARPDRREQRIATLLDGGLREQGHHRAPTRILNVSRHGFKAETDRKLVPGSIVWLSLDGIDPQIARVVWSDQAAAGCAFITPLRVEDFRLLIRSPGLPAFLS